MYPYFERLDGNSIPEGRGDCRAFLVCHNEIERLPYALDYHRALGVSRFVIVDNASFDGTPEYLLTQPDCHVFRTESAFGAALGGSDWLNSMLELHGRNSWNLVLDADELFVFPHSDVIDLPRLCTHLDRIGSQGMFAFLIDMYSRGPIAEADCRRGEPFFDSCSWFDQTYSFQSRFPGRLAPWSWPGIDVIGGPRLRCFYPELRDLSRADYMLRRSVQRLRAWSPARPLAGSLPSVLPPMLTKIPLTKGNSGVRYINKHKTMRIRLAPEMGAILHFKYFSDFHRRVEVGVQKGQYFNSSSEYTRYLRALNQSPGMSFHYPGSVRYEGPQQLSELGLIRSSPALDTVAAGETLGTTNARTSTFARVGA